MTRVPVSFEFFPPKTDEQRTQLDRTATRLKAHAPEYVLSLIHISEPTRRS